MADCIVLAHKVEGKIILGTEESARLAVCGFNILKWMATALPPSMRLISPSGRSA